MTDAMYERWAEDGEVLAQIGRALFGQPTRISVRLPRALADQALAAWQRDAENEPALPPETPEQRHALDRAASLGLIGLSIESGGVADGEDVVVDIDARHIGDAFRAADEDGLLRDVRPPNTR